MEDEPEVEQPDHADQMIHQQLLLEDEEGEMPEDDEDDEDGDEITQLHEVSMHELNAVVKEENYDQPMQKKGKSNFTSVNTFSKLNWFAFQSN